MYYVWKVCVAGIGLVGDLCRNLSNGIITYSDNLVEALVNNLTVSFYKIMVWFV